MSLYSITKRIADDLGRNLKQRKTEKDQERKKKNHASPLLIILNKQFQPSTRQSVSINSEGYQMHSPKLTKFTASTRYSNGTNVKLTPCTSGQIVRLAL